MENSFTLPPKPTTITPRLIKAVLIMLNTLKPAPGSRKKAKRIARGNSGSGGTTAGKGTKGQQSRTGNGRRFGFEGGQTPLLRRQPKFGGFTNPKHKEYEVINISVMEEKLSAGTYDLDSLRKAKLIRTKKPVKLLANGEVKKKFNVTVDKASAKAKEAIEKAGGKVTVLQA